MDSGPDNWRLVYSAIEEMRSKRDAPVDIVGSGCLADKSMSGGLEMYRFQTLVAVLLSSQTRDGVVAEAMRRLFEYYQDRGGLSAANVSSTSTIELDTLLSGVGFHSKKASYLKQTAQMVQELYHGDIPSDMESLCSLPGIGPKMAYLTMLYAWKRCVGIAVDVHVHRISARLGWTTNCADPEQTRLQLQRWLPSDLWPHINNLIVGFGQQRCTARNPACSGCAALTWCPFGKKAIQSNSKPKPKPKSKPKSKPKFKPKSKPKSKLKSKPKSKPKSKAT